MRKKVFIPGLSVCIGLGLSILILSCSQQKPSGMVIKYDDQFLVLEKERSTSAQNRLFAFFEDAYPSSWREIKNNGDMINIYIVKDTIKAISPLFNKLINSCDLSFSKEAYELWKNGKKSYQENDGQRYNASLTRSTAVSAKSVFYFDKKTKEIKENGYRIGNLSPRLPLENWGLFFSLILLSIVIRNAFNNYRAVNLVTVVALYLLVATIFLGFLCLRFSQVPKNMIAALVVGLIVLELSNLPLEISFKHRRSKRRARLGLITIISMSLITGTLCWLSFGYDRFIILSLSAGTIGYILPIWRGRFEPKKKFQLQNLEKD